MEYGRMRLGYRFTRSHLQGAAPSAQAPGQRVRITIRWSVAFGLDLFVHEDAWATSPTLSAVLRSDRAVQVSLTIMRTSVKLRQILAPHRDLARKVEEHDKQIAILFDTLQELLAAPATKKNLIGYIHPND